MSQAIADIQFFLASHAPFDRLPTVALDRLAQASKLLRYRMGQVILTKEKLPAQVSVLYDGQVRLLGYEPVTQLPVTLERLQLGAILGWVGLLRRVPCETAIASVESICLTIPAKLFLDLLKQYPEFAEFFQRPALIEVYELLHAELQRHANSDAVLRAAAAQDLKELAQKVLPQAVIAGKQPLNGQAQNYCWLVSGGESGVVGDRVTDPDANGHEGDLTRRLLGLPADLFTPATLVTTVTSGAAPATVSSLSLEIRDAPDQPPEPDASLQAVKPRTRNYPIVRGQGSVDGTLASLQMLAQWFQIPFRREVVRKVLANQYQRTGGLSLYTCGAVAEMMGLQAQLTRIPLSLIHRAPTPALIQWREDIVVLYEAGQKACMLGTPQAGLIRQQPEDLIPRMTPAVSDDRDSLTETATTPGDRPAPPPETIEILLLQPTRDTPKQKFGLSWFLPSLVKYRGVLVEVFIASFFVQLFGLANPLMTQLIIDKVLVQNSPDTLQIFGIFLIVIALFEAVLTSLRTYLFVDTTNRIDMALGSEIIDHLLRLPLRYFERRPVGELATRMNELENIRQFMTGTALTVGLDAVFSVIYIVVMFIYSWVLTLVALATLPLFALLTAIASPIIRRQLRVKAERNAESQSYLVEVLSGIQTVKAQNIELRSRWQWQQRYARYVSAGFKTVLTSTTAGSASHFLNQLSGLLVLWVGAYLVLQGKLTLGQLIAFRIIAGYVTSPLLRLTQLWQNFQETALSLERLADIIDSPMEADVSDRQNIPMPTIQGQVKYENVSFRFNPSGAMQLDGINLEFPAGAFVGVVGQSGSGKSTLMKLLPRLYPLEFGRILIDGYDINKVELYSLRQQIGIVPQDTLLFEGTVQENIALNYPDASPEEIIGAAQVAAAHDFIMELPNGYNTRVGERGSALSGGQRQRIAIARTILQNPRLLILDEATSALDYDSERQVCLNLAEAFKGRTVFFITHRLTTIRNADIILLMDKGTVVEQGTHDELMALKGRYYCLYRQQDSQL